jgi:shikimate 5-dehydrogenase
MINRDTLLCMSLAGRPGNFGTRFHNYLYEKLGLNYIYKAFTTGYCRGGKGYAHWGSRLRGLDAV